MGRATGRFPPGVVSSRLPSPSSSGAEMVPVPSRSPGRRLQPLQVWCATIWATVQYMCRALLADEPMRRQPLRLHRRGEQHLELEVERAARWSASSSR